jgi:thiaminase
VLPGSCGLPGMQKEILNHIPDTKLHKIMPNDFNYTHSTPIDQILCACKSNVNKAKKILPTGIDTKQIVVFNPCAKSLFAAFWRQIRTNPIFKKQTIMTFQNYCDTFFDLHISHLLDDFEYSLDEWVNELDTLSKQKEIIEYYLNTCNDRTQPNELSKDTCTSFPKTEKQSYDGDMDTVYCKCKLCKNRCISACPASVKYVMGPVINALEKVFHKHVPGYKTKYPSYSQKQGKISTWDELEECYDTLHATGYNNTVDIDGSAWDSTMHYDIKYLVFKIYNYLVDHNKIHHVDSQLFKLIATKRTRQMVAKTFIEGRSFVVASAMVDSTTFSGWPDTTFLNTTINAIVTRFTYAHIGYDETDMHVQCAGDDGTTFLTHIKPNLQTKIKTIWTELGLIPKKVDLGNIADVTYCSTEVIQYFEKCTTKFKIVQQVHRLDPLAHYSVKALRYSRGQMKKHYEELAIGLSYWTQDMPFFSHYEKAYRYHASKISELPQDIPIGKPKNYYVNGVIESKQKQTQSNKLSYKLDRNSQRRPPDDAVYSFLLNKHGLTKTMIEIHANNLLYGSLHDELTNDCVDLNPELIQLNLDNDTNI